MKLKFENKKDISFYVKMIGNGIYQSQSMRIVCIMKIAHENFFCQMNFHVNGDNLLFISIRIDDKYFAHRVESSTNLESFILYWNFIK